MMCLWKKIVCKVKSKEDKVMIFYRWYMKALLFLRLKTVLSF